MQSDADVIGLDFECGPFLAVHSTEALKASLLKEADTGDT